MKSMAKNIQRIKFSEIFKKYKQPDDFIDAFDAFDKLLNLLCKNRSVAFKIKSSIASVKSQNFKNLHVHASLVK